MSETVTSEAVVAAVQRVGVELVAQEGYLTSLDQQMGDGDLGITLSKIGLALQEFAAATPVEDDIGKWLGKAGMAANKAGSSSFGTLLATALMRGGRAVTGKVTLTGADLAAMFAAADAGVQERGKAQPGDKTVIDALHPAAQAFAAAIDAGQSLREAGEAALAAAEVGRDSVTPLRSRIGRASWVGERTEGKVDPGCEAFVVMLRTVLT
ncbi:MAG: DAK2 domain-containing protein [Caldilinea sp.]